MHYTLGPESVPFPRPATPVRIQTRRAIGDAWETDAAFEFVSASLRVGSAISSAKIRRRYGKLKHPTEGGDPTLHAPADPVGKWVRVQMRSTDYTTLEVSGTLVPDLAADDYAENGTYGGETRYTGTPGEIWYDGAEWILSTAAGTYGFSYWSGAAATGSFTPQGTATGTATSASAASWETAWVGRISGENREAMGASNGASGRQHFDCYGPAQLLQKTGVADAIFDKSGGETARVEWVPGINDRDARGALVGNRTAAKVGDSYLYGGSATWSHFDYCEYLLKQFVEPETGATWSITDATGHLSNLKNTIKIGTTQTALAILRKLIPKEYGLEWLILPDTDGDAFEIYVFSLVARDYAFAGKTLPTNGNTLEIQTSQTTDSISTQIIASSDQQYRQIRILGRRIIVCCSLYGADGDLEAKWPQPLEAEYVTAAFAVTADAEDCDAERDSDRYRAVFQQFGTPADWDFRDGDAAPTVDDYGEWTGDGSDSAEIGDFQTQTRSTLRWLPLLEGVDYADGATIDSNPADHIPELLPPTAWLWKDADQSDSGSGSAGRYIPAEEAGCHVTACRNSLGLWMKNGKANHLIAENHWSGAGATDTAPEYDWEEMVATVAFESDQRLSVTYTADTSASGSDGDDDHAIGTLDIEVPDAELWYLAPFTALRPQPDPDSASDEAASIDYLVTSGPVGRVLRNDNGRLAAVMAGALSRYVDARARAAVTIKGRYQEAAQYLGMILLEVDQGGGVSTPIGGPVTAIEWTENETRIIGGYARG